MTRADIRFAMEILCNLLKDFSVLKVRFRDVPHYELPSTPQELLARLEEIVTVFNSDMSFDAKSPHAERYALCLLADGKPAEALELFNLIAEDEPNLLLIHDPPQNGCYTSKITADTHRKLGYEGVYQYAKLLLEKNPQRAKRLLLEIAEKIPTNCPPMRLGDLRADSIKMLMDLGVHTIKGLPIAKQLKEARRHQC